MTKLIITGIVSLLGVISTITAWNLNPKRKLYEEIDKIHAQIDEAYRKRDKALQNNNSPILSTVIIELHVLKERRDNLYQRLKKSLF